MYKRAEKVKLIVDNMKQGQSLYAAIQNAGVRSHATVINWRRENPRIEKLLKRAEELCASKRDGMVVDSLFKQAMAGNPTCIAIYLKFKMGWRDNSLVDQSSHHTYQLINYGEINSGSDKNTNRLIPTA